MLTFPFNRLQQFFDRSLSNRVVFMVLLGIGMVWPLCHSILDIIHAPTLGHWMTLVWWVTAFLALLGPSVPRSDQDRSPVDILTLGVLPGVAGMVNLVEVVFWDMTPAIRTNLSRGFHGFMIAVLLWMGLAYWFLRWRTDREDQGTGDK